MTETRGADIGGKASSGSAPGARGYHARVLRTAILVALSVASTTVVAPSARAEDPPGLALAKRLVEEMRGDEHKAKMRIVWPTDVAPTPLDGAEVVLIDGYMSYTMTRLVWRGGKVEAGSVSAARSWFYNAKGESYAARTLDVDAKSFAEAWSAALYIAGARDEQIDPKSAYKDSPRGSGSHEPHRWTRLRVADESAPRCFGDARCAFGLWETARVDAIYACLAALTPKAESAGRVVDASTWRATVCGELRRACGRLDLSYKGEHRLLLEVCLRVAGEVGDADTLHDVERLATALHEVAENAAWRDGVGSEIGIARTKLGLIVAWDDSKAAEVIRAGSDRKYAKEDLTKWVRRRWRAQNAEGYAAFLVEELDAGGPKALPDLFARLDEVRELRESRAVEFVRGRLDHANPAVRVGAARALIAIDPTDRTATSLLLAAADDAPLTADGGRYGVTPTPRVDALNECVDRGLLTAKDVRDRLARADDPGGVAALLDVLRRTKQPPTDDETRAAWRRLLESKRPDHVLDAVSELLDLHDRDARQLLVAALDRCAKHVEVRKSESRQSKLERLLDRLAKEMPEETPPK
jgi:hypothetical protein